MVGFKRAAILAFIMAVAGADSTAAGGNTNTGGGGGNKPSGGSSNNNGGGNTNNGGGSNKPSGNGGGSNNNNGGGSGYTQEICQDALSSSWTGVNCYTYSGLAATSATDSTEIDVSACGAGCAKDGTCVPASN